MAQDPPSRFERHRGPATFLLSVASLVLFLGLLEAGAWLYCRVNDVSASYDRSVITSGYSVFRSTPHAAFSTIRARPADPQAVFDEFGFLSDGPVSEAREPDSIRIFLLGGSGALGYGQNSGYAGSPEYRYPQGIYTWRLSIAGQLARLLRQAFPAKNVEVITAATINRTFHQSVLTYLEQISRFSPDLVINFEGYNDIYTLPEGIHYRRIEEIYGDYMLRQRAVQAIKGRTWLSLALYDLFPGVLDRVFGWLTDGEFANRVVTYVPFTRPYDSYTRSEYLPLRAGYADRAERFLQILDQYVAGLEADGVGLLFCFQPMLHRSTNKPLSKKEHYYRSLLNPAGYDTAEAEPGIVDARTLWLKYFIDEYLSDAVGARMAAGGNRFLDFNREAQELPEGFELYVDYTHTTARGNRFIAERMSEAVLPLLSR